MTIILQVPEDQLHRFTLVTQFFLHQAEPSEHPGFESCRHTTIRAALELGLIEIERQIRLASPTEKSGGVLEKRATAPASGIKETRG